MTLDLTVCPQCRGHAEVEWRAVLESTDGPIEHARIRCLRGHWFLLPVASLAGATAPGAGPSGARRRRAGGEIV